MAMIATVRENEKFILMTSTSSEEIVRVSSSISIPRNNLGNIGHLAEYTTVPENAVVSESVYPLMSPYNLYRRKTPGFKSIRHLLKQQGPKAKEYVQASALTQQDIRYAEHEQYISLQFNTDLITSWKAEGYTHLHLGAIRIILTFQGRKGLPITARSAILDTRFVNYTHALLGTCLSTLNNGSVILTIFPNYTVSLNDPNLPSMLQVQLQIAGAGMVDTSVMANLHHQIVYRLQNHSMDLPTSTGSDVPVIIANHVNQDSTVLEMATAVSRSELLQHMPTEWVTNYEKMFTKHESIQATRMSFESLPDGRVKTKFQLPSSDAPGRSFSQFLLLPLNEQQRKQQKDVPVHCFGSAGNTVYTDKVNGHFIWDVAPEMCDPDCDCDQYTEEDIECEDPRSKRARKWRAKHAKTPCHHQPSDDSDDDTPLSSLKVYFPHDDPSDFPPGLPRPLAPLWKPKKIKLPTLAELQAKLSSQSSQSCGKEASLPRIPDPSPIPCMMMTPFPSPDPVQDPQTFKPSRGFISQNTIDHTGRRSSLTQSEEVLNWQSKNALVQNQMLQQIDQKVDHVSNEVTTLKQSITPLEQLYQSMLSRVQQLDQDLRRMIQTKHFGSEFDHKEKEIRSLQKEIDRIDKEKRFGPPPPLSQSIFSHYGPTFSSPFLPSSPPPTTTPFLYSSYSPESKPMSFFEKYSLELQEQRKQQQQQRKPRKTKPTVVPPTSQPMDLDLYPPPSNPEKQPVQQFASTEIPTGKNSDSSSNSESEEHSSTSQVSTQSSSDFEELTTSGSSYDEQADLTEIFMADTRPDPQTSTAGPSVSEVESETEEPAPPPQQTSQPSTEDPKVSANGPFFTFDDIPFDQRPLRMNEFQAWINLQLSQGVSMRKTITSFCSRMKGSLQDWFTSLGPYRQLQIMQYSLDNFYGLLYREFVGDLGLLHKKFQTTFFKMKCCSVQPKDITKHITRMSKLFYLLNGANNPALKRVFFASFPAELQTDMDKLLSSTGREFDTFGLGELSNIVQEALTLLCEKHEATERFLTQKKKFTKACKTNYEIGCKKHEQCHCKPVHKRRSSRRARPPSALQSGRRRKKIRFFRNKAQSSRKSSRCFLCRKKGHFARNCPTKKAKAANLVSQLMVTHPESDIESLYSEQSFADEDTKFALASSSASSDDDEELQALSCPIPTFTALPLHPICFSETSQSPHIQVTLLASKFAKPLKAIGLLDSGSLKTMVNPKLLPPDIWVPSKDHFVAVNGEVFHSSISKHKIGIRFFPDCTVWQHVYNNPPNGKDLLIGWDCYCKAQQLRLLPLGLRYKGYFQPYSLITHMYAISDAPPLYAQIANQLKLLCADSHATFQHPSPLWKNQEFFVKLPFKLNEDVNPTKASHPGMTPDDLKLAQEECSQLLKLGLIEPTTSSWSCQAFYVNKRTEQIRGKKRLVIDYKPLNHFLKDDKFPLPKIENLFLHLSGAMVFSKFDLKSGFWQLGIAPEDRYKTAFCIPNAQYQWTVMPFGLKVAPSLFQKAMAKIFQNILHSALLYIDDILLFSKDDQAHTLLLSQFFEIINQKGIMLSEKKSHIGLHEVEYLGMRISNGKIQPGPHLVEHLPDFPDTNLTRKQIQQFLGIINYIRIFIPKVSRYMSPLSKLLKKDPIPWGPEQTKAIQSLKALCKTPLPLHIPSTGHRILQTDSSDEFWGALLLEKIHTTLHYCGHASGQFSDPEKHYHISIKEILSVKYAIKKFEFHLIGHQFTIQMDNSSFPKILEFRNKMIPEPQLLRLKDWFSKYQFTVQHIPGKSNILADFLSRPKKTFPLLVSSVNTSIPLFMIGSSSPPELEQFSSISDAYLYAHSNLFHYRSLFCSEYHSLNSENFSSYFLSPPNSKAKPYNSLCKLSTDYTFSLNGFNYLWCLSVTCYTALEFNVVSFKTFFNDPRKNSSSLLWKFLTWFQTSEQWATQFEQLLQQNGPDPLYICYVFKRDYTEKQVNNTTIVDPENFIQQWPYPTSVSMALPSSSPEQSNRKQALYDYLVALNECITPADSDQGLSSSDIASSQFPHFSDPPETSPDFEPDSQDPWETDHQINWEGFGLYWTEPFSPLYYQYHNG